MNIRLLALLGVATPLLVSCDIFKTADNVSGSSGEIENGERADASVHRDPNSNTYRLLTAVQNESFVLDNIFLNVSNSEFSSACERLLGFKTVMTSARVISAREIQIPLEAIEEFRERVPVVRARETTVQPRSDGDLVYEAQKETIYEDEGEEERTYKRALKGMCIGTEYITE